jgi:hypothetical protein
MFIYRFKKYCFNVRTHFGASFEAILGSIRGEDLAKMEQHACKAGIQRSKITNIIINENPKNILIS